MQLVTAAEAVSNIHSGDNVFIQSTVCSPMVLIKAMTARSPELKGVHIYHIHTEGAAPYAAMGMQGCFTVNSLFIGANLREAVQAGRADFIPNFLSEIPDLFRKNIIPLDVALIHVSPPDKHGFCSLGASVDIANAATDTAKMIIAQVNPNMPRTFGDGIIHSDKIHFGVVVNDKIPEIATHDTNAIECAIGGHIAGLIEDGATLQMGIGAIPNAVLSFLGNHKNLGVHSEMFSDGILPLVEKGVINNSQKIIRPEKIVASFVMGTRRLYDFIDDNPMVELLDISFVNNPHIIRKNPKVTAINSAIEVDLTGQVCADSIGNKMYSGVGGQVDFIRGASLSEGGKPIIALPSRTSNGLSRIVPFLKQGAGVTTTRAHVHYIITEFGIANLYGKTLKQRAKDLVSISHPDCREELERAAFEIT
jgi:4-hydroxybutyrate CoA-transferase